MPSHGRASVTLRVDGFECSRPGFLALQARLTPTNHEGPRGFERGVLV